MTNLINFKWGKTRTDRMGDMYWDDDMHDIDINEDKCKKKWTKLDHSEGIKIKDTIYPWPVFIIPHQDKVNWTGIKTKFFFVRWELAKLAKDVSSLLEADKKKYGPNLWEELDDILNDLEEVCKAAEIRDNEENREYNIIIEEDMSSYKSLGDTFEAGVVPKRLGEIFGNRAETYGEELLLLGGSRYRGKGINWGRGRGNRLGLGGRMSMRANQRRKRGRARVNEDRIVRIRQHGRFMPDRFVANLRWADTTTSRTHASSNACNWAYRSSAYDPDPSFGTGAIPGFAELANMYSQYLVRKMKLYISVVNQNTQSGTMVIWPSIVVQNVNSLVAADLLEYASNPNGRSFMVPTTNGGLTELRCTATGKRLFGRQFMTDLDFTGSTSGNPVTMYGINLGFFLNDGSALTYVLATQVSVTYEVEFFGLRQLES